MIDRVIPSQGKELGGFSVRRALPSASQRSVGPWVFFDHMGPTEFPPGGGMDVRPHPHINLATVTYLFEGEIWHRDSLGNSEPIRPGDVNLMVAGRGIVHSERTRPELRQKGYKLHGLQLWLALPEKDEEVDPAFYHYDSREIPKAHVGDVSVRVIIGQAYGKCSPVKTFVETIYIEARLKKGQSLKLPQAPERAIYVAQGELEVQGEEQPITEYNLAVLSGGQEQTVSAVQDSFVVLLGGEAIGKRHMFWNFVSSRLDRIDRAKQNWIEKKFPRIPGDSEEFIPLPEGPFT